MADRQIMTAAEIAEEHAVEAHTPYLKVWAWLAALTAVEYFYAYFCQEVLLTPFLITLFGLLLWAAIKAGMVGWFFMHLKFEGKWVYGLIIPACVLAAILVLALTPDIAYRPTTEENEEEEAVWVAPAPVSPVGEARLIVSSRLAQGPAGFGRVPSHS